MSAVHDEARRLWCKALERLNPGLMEIDPADYENADERLIAELAVGVQDMTDNYDGAMEDCDSAVMVLIARIQGKADLDSAKEWVCLNYPRLAFENRLMDDAQRARYIARQATGE